MKNKTIIGYKFVTDELKSKNGNHKWKIGEWFKFDGELKMCESGFHACRTPLQSLQYAYGDKWFVVEAKGKIIDEKDDKFVCSEMRLIKEILPESAAESAESAARSAQNKELQRLIDEELKIKKRGKKK